MAAIAGPGICENRDRPMSKKLTAAAPSVASGKVPAPVRVRLKRVNCDQAIPYPPDGQTREWWHRLKNAFGTTSSAFVEASLYQLIAAARTAEAVGTGLRRRSRSADGCDRSSETSRKQEAGR